MDRLLQLQNQKDLLRIQCEKNIGGLEAMKSNPNLITEGLKKTFDGAADPSLINTMVTLEILHEVFSSMAESTRKHNTKRIEEGKMLPCMVIGKGMMQELIRDKSPEEFIWWIVHSSDMQIWDDESEKWLDERIIENLNKIPH